MLVSQDTWLLFSTITDLWSPCAFHLIFLHVICKMDMDISLQPAQTQLQNLSQFLIFVLKFQNTSFSFFSNELISELENF